MNQKILNINNVHEANYSHGKFKKKARFKIEFKRTGGFRSVVQTINPTTNKLSNPKNSPYAHFRCQYINEENEQIENTTFYFSTYECVNSHCQFIANNFDALQLTKEMRQAIYTQLFILLKMTEMRANADREKLSKLLKPTLDLINHGMDTGENVFPQINLDVEGIDQLKKEFIQQ